MKTAEEILNQFSINKDTKHHNYDYLYQSMIKAIELSQFKHPAPSEDWVEEVMDKLGEPDVYNGSNHLYLKVSIRTALQSVTIPQTQTKQLDLDEVEKLVQHLSRNALNPPKQADIIRSRIGYTLNDLKP